jgi:uncharacterized membrane protein YccC
MPLIEWAAGHWLEIGLTLRMSAAGLIAFAVGHLLGLPQVYWAVLTAVIVMQASIGGSLKAMIDRFAGTIGGAGWGVAATLAVPQTSALWTGLALAVALVPLAALTAFKPSYRIAPVTAAIVLLAYSNRSHIVEAALDRVFEIGLGSVVALLVALIVTPSRAHDVVGVAARDALSLMAEQARNLLCDLAVAAERNAVTALHDRIRAAIERANNAADEARRERRSYLSDAPDPDPIVRDLRRLGHDLVIIGRALRRPLADAVAARLGAPAAAIAENLAAVLNGMGTAVAGGSEPPDLLPMQAALAQFDAAIAALRRDGITRDLPDEAVERVFGLAFALEQIGRNLDELAGCVRDSAGRR